MDVERVLCLTATATKSVAEDICKNFFIHPTEGVFRTPVFRSKSDFAHYSSDRFDVLTYPRSLAFRVEVAQSLPEKIAKVVPILQSRTGPAILYVTLQKHAVDVAAELRAYGLDSMVYHAGLSNDERDRVQTQFMASETGIVCATIAFGMGIDKGI